VEVKGGRSEDGVLAVAGCEVVPLPVLYFQFAAFDSTLARMCRRRPIRASRAQLFCSASVLTEPSLSCPPAFFAAPVGASTLSMLSSQSPSIVDLRSSLCSTSFTPYTDSWTCSDGPSCDQHPDGRIITYSHNERSVLGYTRKRRHDTTK
jgi:hypothetical protein